MVLLRHVTGRGKIRREDGRVKAGVLVDQQPRFSTMIGRAKQNINIQGSIIGAIKPLDEICGSHRGWLVRKLMPKRTAMVMSSDTTVMLPGRHCRRSGIALHHISRW